MSAADQVVAATVISLFFSVSALAIRCLARRAQHMRQYSEDYLIYLALLFKVAIDIAGVTCKQRAVTTAELTYLTGDPVLCHGLGKHIDTVSREQLVIFLKVPLSHGCDIGFDRLTMAQP